MTFIVDQLREALSEVGVCRGSHVMIHCDLQQAGFEKEDGKLRLALPPHKLTALLQEMVGYGGILMTPVFSYSWSSGLAYDPTSSPCRIGTFGEFFRQQPGVVRSSHPMMSVAAWGSQASEYTRAGDMSSFGAESIYARLAERDVLQIMLGTSKCSLNDYVQTIRETPHRYPKFFRDPEIDGGDAEVCLHHVRYMDVGDSLQTTVEGLDHDLRKCITHVTCGRLEVFAVRTKALVEAISTQLERNPLSYMIEPRYEQEIFLIAKMHSWLKGQGIFHFAVQLGGRERWVYASSSADGSQASMIRQSSTPSDATYAIQLASEIGNSDRNESMSLLWDKLRESSKLVFNTHDKDMPLSKIAQEIYRHGT